MFRSICPCFSGVEDPNLLTRSRKDSYGSIDITDEVASRSLARPETPCSPISRVEPIHRTSYEWIRFLGRGGFGVVNLVKDTKTQTLYAMKKASFEKSERLIRNEGKILKNITSLGGASHHIVSFESMEIEEGKASLYLEFIEGEDLFERVTKTKEKGVPLSFVKNIAIQVLDAIIFLADNGITHGDIKPENILIDERQKVTLINFSLAFKGESKGFPQVTMYYASPEVAAIVPVTSAADVWGLGVTLMSVYTGTSFFSDTNVSDLIRSHEIQFNKLYPKKFQSSRYYPRGDRGLIIGDFSFIHRAILYSSREKQEENIEVQKFLNFINRILEFDPEKRMIAQDALNDPFCLDTRKVDDLT